MSTSNPPDFVQLARELKPTLRERIPVEDRVAYRANAGAATDRMVKALDDLFMASGGSAIFLDQDIQRFFQDIHGARAHHANNPLKAQRNYGGLLMGEPTTDFFL